jgi:hypothetical protein
MIFVHAVLSAMFIQTLMGTVRPSLHEVAGFTAFVLRVASCIIG